MPLPDISIHISANTVAWYAAIVSTVGLLATIYTAWKDRPRVKITINPDILAPFQALAPSFPTYRFRS